MTDKKLAYKNMGRCYQEFKNYTCAIRCYKKLLEISWYFQMIIGNYRDTNDNEAEINAYEGLGVQYFYLG